MPSFSFSSSIRVASQDYVLRLNVTHNLVHGSPSDRIHTVKGRLPKELDVLWLSDITIALSGSIDARQIPAHDISSSGITRHLRAQLKTNADQLGLNNVSRPFIDDVDGLSKLTLTPSRPLPIPSRPFANLVSLHLAYNWRSVDGRSDMDSSDRLSRETDPFSSTLFLPAETLLNRVTEQFFIYHLVGRYPLIFGPWPRRLDLEMQHFPSISNSIVEIMVRSENRGFMSKCQRLLKVARSQHKFVLHGSAAALSSCAHGDAEEVDDPPPTPALTDEQILCESLEQLFRVGVPQRRFKPAAIPRLVSLPRDDDESLLMSDKIAEDESCWVELSEIAMSPTDYHQMLPEDMDIFAQEDGPENRMWRIHEADTGQVDATPAPCESIMWEAQSDESLIDAPASLASITTRSPQACSFTLYHPQDVDYGELDPAANGSRDNVSHLALLEEAETSVLLANWTHLPLNTPHDRCFPDDDEQVIQASDSFEILDSEDSDSILVFDEPDGHLEWLV